MIEKILIIAALLSALLGVKALLPSKGASKTKYPGLPFALYVYARVPAHSFRDNGGAFFIRAVLKNPAGFHGITGWMIAVAAFFLATILIFTIPYARIKIAAVNGIGISSEGKNEK